MMGPNGTREQYASMSRFQRIVYWVLIALAAGLILYFWFVY
jgi:hypothetical protein